jgi:hypothetical protein
MMVMRRFWRVTFSVFSHYPLFWTLPYIYSECKALGKGHRNQPPQASSDDTCRRDEMAQGAGEATPEVLVPLLDNE